LESTWLFAWERSCLRSSRLQILISLRRHHKSRITVWNYERTDWDGHGMHDVQRNILPARWGNQRETVSVRVHQRTFSLETKWRLLEIRYHISHQKFSHRGRGIFKKRVWHFFCLLNCLYSWWDKKLGRAEAIVVHQGNAVVWSWSSKDSVPHRLDFLNVWIDEYKMNTSLTILG